MVRKVYHTEAQRAAEHPDKQVREALVEQCSKLIEEALGPEACFVVLVIKDSAVTLASNMHPEMLAATGGGLIQRATILEPELLAHDEELRNASTEN